MAKKRAKEVLMLIEYCQEMANFATWIVLHCPVGFSILDVKNHYN